MNKIFKTLSLSIFVLVFVIFIIYLTKVNYKETINVTSPTVLQNNSNVDLNNDGNFESIKIIQIDNNKQDIEITTIDKTFLLSSLTKNNYLSNCSNSYSIKVRLLNISRDNKPRILVQGYLKEKPVTYLFSYTDKNFKLEYYCNNSNISGIIDSNLNRTPQIAFFNSSDLNKSFKNFMIINNNLIDISKNSIKTYGASEILKLIDIICLEYEVVDYPNIFHKNATDDSISPIWSLNKNDFMYSFKNGFFYDNEVDKNGVLQNISWSLQFEKINKISNEKEIFKLNVESSRDENNNFKISSIK